jgi:hypothetical protein
METATGQREDEYEPGPRERLTRSPATPADITDRRGSREDPVERAN